MKKKNKEMDAAKKQEQEDSTAELESYLNRTRPRNLVEGVTTGISDVLLGTIGGVGSIVLMPVVGMAGGYKSKGLLGGVIGLVGGTLAGVVGGVGAAVVGPFYKSSIFHLLRILSHYFLNVGVLKGTGQIARGIISVPQSIIAPSKGKWWNDIDGKWISTNLKTEAEKMRLWPEDDSDILGDKAHENLSDASEEFQSAGVKDPFYYEVLGVPTDAELYQIKRQYYILARLHHPDKAAEHGSEKESIVTFQSISEAYQVLTDSDLRAIYDREGLNGLTADKTCAAKVENQLDPTILFAFLFGSDKFGDYIGRLAAATNALVEDDISVKLARQLQVRRCTRIATKLEENLKLWILDDVENCVNLWQKQAEELNQASYGNELLLLIGGIYSLAAEQFLGSLDSGIGMPSIARWVKGKAANLEKDRKAGNATSDTISAAMKTAKMNEDASVAVAQARTEQEKHRIAEDLAKEQLSVMLQIMWTMTAVDITSTVHEACQMLFFDQSLEVSKSLLKKRAKGVKKLGEIFMAVPPIERENDPSKLYEEAAFAAMIETVKRKEESSFRAGFSRFHKR